jgi:hypothetical protein
VRLPGLTSAQASIHYMLNAHLVSNMEKLSQSSGEPADVLRKDPYAIMQA